MGLVLMSAAFVASGAIPALFTCEGRDISPALSWTGVPESAKSLVLIVDDPDAPDPAAPKTTWVHWVLYNIPPSARGLPEAVTSGALPPGTREGLNDWKRTGYGGPADRPPPLLPQALRARQRAPRPGRRHQGPGGGRDARPRRRAGRGHGDVSETEVAADSNARRRRRPRTGGLGGALRPPEQERRQQPWPFLAPRPSLLRSHERNG